METRREVRSIQVEFKCPKCEHGFMIHTGLVLTSNPAQYPHKCSNPECDHTETFVGKKYPRLEYEFSTPVIEIREISKVKPLQNLSNPQNPT
jgi:hypothetical protein